MEQGIDRQLGGFGPRNLGRGARPLLCIAGPGSAGGGAATETPAPSSLSGGPVLYGRAFGWVVPVLPSGAHFRLTADAVFRGRELSVSIQSGDPIFPAAELTRRY